MAATRLIALHINKGKIVAQCLADRTDYSQNEKKTGNGKYISSYGCDPRTCDEEFLFSTRQYEHITGRLQAQDVILPIRSQVLRGILLISARGRVRI